jgi:hypothetical protein
MVTITSQRVTVSPPSDTLYKDCHVQVLSVMGRTWKSGFMASAWGQVVGFTWPSPGCEDSGKLAPPRRHGKEPSTRQGQLWQPSPAVDDTQGRAVHRAPGGWESHSHQKWDKQLCSALAQPHPGPRKKLGAASVTAASRRSLATALWKKLWYLKLTGY